MGSLMKANDTQTQLVSTNQHDGNNINQDILSDFRYHYRSDNDKQMTNKMS